MLTKQANKSSPEKQNHSAEEKHWEHWQEGMHGNQAKLAK